METAETVLRFEARVPEIVPGGLVPDGIRLDAHFRESITSGPLMGGTVRGIDDVLIGLDAVLVLDVRDLITAQTGGHIAVRDYWYGTPPAGIQLPPPEVLLRPDVAWPDLAIPLHGVALCQTGATELTWLNRTALAVEDTANPDAGTLAVSAYAFVPIPALALT